MRDLEEVDIHGQPSWRLRSDAVELAVTRRGGHLAPVVFFRDTPHPVAPYYVSPWQDEPGTPEEPVLRMLRGDFFCCPFGANPPGRGERHRVHGEPAHAAWRRAAAESFDGGTALTLAMTTRVRPGRIVKRIVLRRGENAVYLQHELQGYRGAMPLGHHPILAPPPAGRLRLSTGPLRFGQVAPRAALATDGAEYYALAPGRRFHRLDRVPTVWKDRPWSDATVFPAREGFVDILALFARPGPGPAWTCAAAPDAGYLWFALRDPGTLPATVLWMENRGRHGPPWNGRNRCLGVEDVCAYFAEGLAASVARNPLNDAGIPTALRLSPRRPARINHIQGVVRIPRRFDRARRLRFERGGIVFEADSGAAVFAPVRHEFVAPGAPGVELLRD